ncbi:hypothetical protein [Brevundimonas variabilis]|uniref:Type II secretion system protein N n=1 Tax=Brevundimonas variabilis TaxID=74312 RepID=A0A7W9FH77_9CAUL|nr:hypothetical protein [Brevundimonas variabilis]MBB5747179.1 hypothetical protein [Brevundimonas variabilis]
MLRTWKIRDGDGDRSGGAFQFERLAVRVTRWRVILAGVAVGAFALSLVATLPAEVIMPDDRDAVGTVWNGEASLPMGFAAGWSVQPLQSIARVGLASRISVLGPDTAIDGQAVLRPGQVRLNDLDGVGSARLLSAVAADLPFVCDGDMRVAVGELALKGSPAGEGGFRTGPGNCQPRAGGAATPVPALAGSLTADAAATTLTLTRDGSGEALARVRITPAGETELAVEPAGMGVIPLG